ncbi:MAG: Dna2/Cas4 domain-containing protein, partial [Alistipes sp.]|nr:Dna2/Cas4 domain-containing protein [Alistipes sp.]
AQEAPDRRAGKAEQIENVLLDSYPTSPLTQSPRTLSHRYLEEDGEQIRSARSMGVLMHGVLSESADEADVMRRIDLEQKNGHLSDEQASELMRIIEREFCRDEVREWFGEWDEVRSENDILSAGVVGTRRPDRVMIRGERAVVVDYKFGEEQRAAHHRQVATYAQLLREMGYTQIEGYVWYLSLGQIVKVDCNTLAL